MDRIKYYCRRQFVLGSEFVEIQGWRKEAVANELKLTIHPDLAVTRAETENGILILLGYIIDPEAPDRTDGEVLSRILGRMRATRDVIAELNRMSGRFVLVAICGQEQWLFHDAVALRQVHYCRDKEGRAWCASQPHLLAAHFGFQLDHEVLTYRDMEVFQKQCTEFWLLNDRSPYREVRNLLPNHYLELKRGDPVRYWPRADCIPRLSIEESVEACTPFLQNTLRSAAERFSLCMGMSAGIDSRKTLAATREFRGQITYFSHAPNHDALEVNDVRVPARLLPKLGLRHENLGWHPMTAEFRELFEASVLWAREKKGHIAHTVHARFGPECTVLNSNISEVAQCIYWLPKSKLDGRNIAVLNGLNHPFAIEEFQNWLDGALPACREAGMDPLALFFLEQRMGRWCTLAFSEYDIAHETFNPYNNRRLHELMLAVPGRYRMDRQWTVPLRQIKALWPEVLLEPVNPQDLRGAKFKQFVRRFIVHRTITPWLAVYQHLRYVKKVRQFERTRENLAVER